jgi:hypothetical protein
MSLDITLVPPGLIHKTVGSISKYVEKAAEASSGRSSPDDIYKAFFTGAYQLWLVLDKEELIVHGFFATEVKQYPQYKMLVVQHSVIEPNRMHEVEDRMQELAGIFAKSSGCKGIEFVGRHGWRRHAEKYGYRTSSVVYHRFFEEAPK